MSAGGCLGGGKSESAASHLEKLHEIVVLSVNVAADLNGWGAVMVRAEEQKGWRIKNGAREVAVCVG